MHYDINLKKDQTKKHIVRRGLVNPAINLVEIGIIDLVKDNDIDTDLYTVVDTGEREIRDGKAHVIFETKRRTDQPGASIKETMRTKINASRDRICAAGVTFTMDGETAVLQTRDGDWVTLDHLLRDAEKVAPEEVMEIRVESNAQVSMNAAAVITLIEGAITYRNAVIKAASTLKDQISAAADDDAAYDVYEAGIDSVWPATGPIEL